MGWRYTTGSTEGDAPAPRIAPSSSLFPPLTPAATAPPAPAPTAAPPTAGAAGGSGSGSGAGAGGRRCHRSGRRRPPIRARRPSPPTPPRPRRRPRSTTVDGVGSTDASTQAEELAAAPASSSSDTGRWIGLAVAVAAVAALAFGAVTRDQGPAPVSSAARVDPAPSPPAPGRVVAVGRGAGRRGPAHHQPVAARADPRRRRLRRGRRRSDAPWAMSFAGYLQLGAFVIVIRMVFPILFGDRLPGTELFTIPSVTLPELGRRREHRWSGHASRCWSARSTRASAWPSVIVCVGAVNTLCSPYRMLRALPAVLYEAGVAVTVALSFAPQLAITARRVRDARRLRGRPDQGPVGLAGHRAAGARGCARAGRRAGRVDGLPRLRPPRRRRPPASAGPPPALTLGGMVARRHRRLRRARRRARRWCCGPRRCSRSASPLAGSARRWAAVAPTAPATGPTRGCWPSGSSSSCGLVAVVGVVVSGRLGDTARPVGVPARAARRCPSLAAARRARRRAARLGAPPSRPSCADRADGGSTAASRSAEALGGGGVIRFDHVTFTYPDADAARPWSTSTSRSPRASCASSWAPPARASPRCCGPSTAWCPASPAALLQGRVCGRRPQHRRAPAPRARRRRRAWSGQDPAAGFVTDTVEDELAYVMENLGVAPDVMRRRVEDVLDLLGLHELRDRPAGRALGWPAAAGRHRLGAHRRRPGCWCSTSRPRRSTPPPPRRSSPPSPAWCTTSASPCCWPSTASSGSCSTPTGSCSSPAPGQPRRRSASPAEILADARRSCRRSSSSAAWPAGRRCRCRSATPVGPPPTSAPASRPSPPTPPVGRVCADRGRRGRAAGRRARSWPGPRGCTPATGRWRPCATSTSSCGPARSWPSWAATARASRPCSSHLVGLRVPGRGAVLVGGREPARAAGPRGRARASGSCPRTPACCSTTTPSPPSARPATTTPTWPPGTTRRRARPARARHRRPAPIPATSPRASASALALAVVLAAEPPLVLLDEPTRGLDYAAKHRLVARPRRPRRRGPGRGARHPRRRGRGRGRRPGHRAGRRRGRGRRPGPRGRRATRRCSPPRSPRSSPPSRGSPSPRSPPPSTSSPAAGARRDRHRAGARVRRRPRPGDAGPGMRLRTRSWLLLAACSLIGAGRLRLAAARRARPARPSTWPTRPTPPGCFAVLLPLLLAVVLAELADGALDAKAVALLGVLAACGAALRLPSGGVAGFEPVFFLLIPAGRVLGRGFGFVLGALTLFVSALLTGGVGPWLPFQMLGRGLGGLLRRLPPAGAGPGRGLDARRLRRRRRPGLRAAAEPVVLAVRAPAATRRCRSCRVPAWPRTSATSGPSTWPRRSASTSPGRCSPAVLRPGGRPPDPRRAAPGLAPGRVRCARGLRRGAEAPVAPAPAATADGAVDAAALPPVS